MGPEGRETRQLADRHRPSRSGRYWSAPIVFPNLIFARQKGNSLVHIKFASWALTEFSVHQIFPGCCCAAQRRRPRGTHAVCPTAAHCIHSAALHAWMAVYASSSSSSSDPSKRSQLRRCTAVARLERRSSRSTNGSGCCEPSSSLLLLPSSSVADSDPLYKAHAVQSVQEGHLFQTQLALAGQGLRSHAGLGKRALGLKTNRF